jgi:hypothetical protein
VEIRAEQLGDGPEGGFIFDPFFHFFWVTSDYERQRIMCRFVKPKLKVGQPAPV